MGVVYLEDRIVPGLVQCIAKRLEGISSLLAFDDKNTRQQLYRTG